MVLLSSSSSSFSTVTHQFFLLFKLKPKRKEKKVVSFLSLFSPPKNYKSFGRKLKEKMETSSSIREAATAAAHKKSLVENPLQKQLYIPAFRISTLSIFGGKSFSQLQKWKKTINKPFTCCVLAFYGQYIQKTAKIYEQ